MTFYRKTILTITGMTGLFLLCGLLHVLLYGQPFTSCFSQLFCGSLTLLWTLAVRSRVTDPRLCRLLVLIAYLLILYYILQTLRYSLPDGPVRRWSWYAYYIPMTVIPVLYLYLSLYIHRPRDEHPSRIWLLPAVVAFLLIAGILTNDLHHLAFFTSGEILAGNGEEQPGILYYLFLSFFILTMLLSYTIVLWKSRRPPTGTLYWLPPVPLLMEAVFLILSNLGLSPRIHGIILWNFGEFFAFCTILFLEICIQIGLIPSNSDYEKLFTLADLPAVILDRDGQPVYQTKSTVYPFPDNEDTDIVSHPISGGSIQWSVNTYSLRMLNQELQRTIQQVEARNAYLENKNAIREEKVKLETQERLYHRIAEIISPQTSQIDRILRDIEGGPRGISAGHAENSLFMEYQLPRIAFLTAYIKRRSNLELLAADGKLSTSELEMALRESLEYLNLKGVNTALTMTGDHLYSPVLVTAVYEEIEGILEECFETLTDLMIVLRAASRRLVVRMMIQAAGFSSDLDDAAVTRGSISCHTTLIRDGGDLLLTMTFMEEGDG